jgi:hypothetical protein
MKNFEILKVQDIEIIVMNTENGEKWHVPSDLANRHYQDYLAWVAEGNKPDIIETEK